MTAHLRGFAVLLLVHFGVNAASRAAAQSWVDTAAGTAQNILISFDAVNTLSDLQAAVQAGSFSNNLLDYGKAAVSTSEQIPFVGTADLALAAYQGYEREAEYNLSLSSAAIEQAVITAPSFVLTKGLSTLLTGCFASGGCSLTAGAVGIGATEALGIAVDGALISADFEGSLDYLHEINGTTAVYQQIARLADEQRQEVEAKRLQLDTHKSLNSQTPAGGEATQPKQVTAKGVSQPASKSKSVPGGQTEKSGSPPSGAGAKQAIAQTTTTSGTSASQHCPVFFCSGLETGSKAVQTSGATSGTATGKPQLGTTPGNGSSASGQKPTEIGVGPATQVNTFGGPALIGEPAQLGPIGKPVIIATPTIIGSVGGNSPATYAAPSTMHAVGGISLSAAAAERLPLNLTLDGAYIQKNRIILAGHKNSSGSIDAALFLTALRAACGGADPYFSLDPDNMASWLAETRQADTELHEAIKRDSTWHFRKHIRRNAPSILRFKTISASQDYPQLWNSMLAKYPDLRSRLVFRPDWLRQTRFGEIMYKADVLLKELAGGATALGESRFRADGIGDYRSATERMAAIKLLYQYNGWSQQQGPHAGGRIWYDLTESSNIAVGAPEQIPQAKSELHTLLQRRELLTNAPEQSPAQKISENGGAIDLSDIYPRMFVRVRDPITYRDSAARFPGLDELVAQANRVPQQYATAYSEYEQLVQVFRAYIVAVRARQAEPVVCAHLPTQLLDSEKVRSPLPAYHPTDLMLTIGWYEYQDGRLRRVIGDIGGLFQGGVSIGVNRFFRFAVQNVAVTPVITELKMQAIKPTKDFSWNGDDDRQYVALTFDGIPATDNSPAGPNVDNRFPGNVLPSVDEIAEASSPNGSVGVGDPNLHNGEQRVGSALPSAPPALPRYAQTNTPSPDSTTTWFALAVAPQGTYGWSKERPTKDAAEEEAFRACASVTSDPQQCKVIIVPRGSCVAIEQCTSSGQPAIWSAISDHLKDALNHSLMQAVAAGMSEKACKALTHWCPQ